MAQFDECQRRHDSIVQGIVGFTLRQIQVFHQCRQAQIDIGVVVLLIRRQLLELVVVIQRGNFDTDRKFNRMRPSMARVLGLETRSANEG